MNFPETFKAEITSFTSDNGQGKFCYVFPSKIQQTQSWSTPHSLSNPNYDSIIHDGTYFYLLDTETLDILVVQDFQKASTQYTILSSKPNKKQSNGVYNTPWLVIDSNKQYLYIITEEFIMSYKVADLYTAIAQGTTVPKITQDAFTGTKHLFTSITGAQIYNSYLFLSADNNIVVYLASQGTLAKTQTLDKQYVNGDTVNFVDFTFRGTVIYALDKLRGVFAFDISNAQAIHAYPDSIVEISGADWVEVVGDALNIISSQSKNPAIYEYIITDTQNGPILTKNRQVELYQSVRDVYSDSKYLYLITGYINLSYKHSIPGRFNTSDLSYLATTWVYYDAKAMVAIDKKTQNATDVIVLSDDYIQNFTFYEDEPQLECDTRGVKEGIYEYNINLY